MWTRSFWILTTLLFVVAFWIFAYFSANNTLLSTSESIPKYWDHSGEFVYTGSTISNIFSDENIFTGTIAIDGIKTIFSEKNFSPKYYIEYPNFSNIQNVEILARIRKESIGFASKNNTGTGFLSYSSHFSLLWWQGRGAIFYHIYEHTVSEAKEKHRKIFHINSSWKIFDSKELLNVDRKMDFANYIVSFFLKKFPNEKIKNNETVLHNITEYLNAPEFAFSGSEVILSIPSNNFVDTNSTLPDFLELHFSYEEVKNFIFLEPKKEIKDTISNSKKNITSGDTKKYVALTFDDGPWKFTNELLTILRQKNVRATFFVLGQNVEGYEGTLQWMDADWHEIASHSWSHPSFLKISNHEIRSQIEKTDLAIKKAIGKKPALFRPPYWAYNAQVNKIVNKTILMWSVDSFDWKNRNVQKNIKTTMNQVHDGAIILYHDIHKTSVDTISPLIDALRDSWYEFLTVSEMYAKYYNNEAFLPEQVCFSMKRCQ